MHGLDRISIFYLYSTFNCLSIRYGRYTYLSILSCLDSLANVNLPYFTTEITTESSPFALSLAKHLRSIGAKMYGAFWCSHCLEQKQVLLAFTSLLAVLNLTSFCSPSRQ